MKIFSFTILLTFFALSVFSQEKAFTCGFDDNNLPESMVSAMQMAPTWAKERNAKKTSNEMYVCRIAIDIDSETYNYFNQDTLFIQYEIIKMIEKVSEVYEREINTRLVVTHINIWKDSKTDPYFGTLNIFSLLDILKSTWRKEEFKKINFDNVMYLPHKQFTLAGGVASENFSVSRFGFYSTIAHELGHNFNSPHTQSCLWPGGMLDFCTIPEGNCYNGALERINGTIMSYCYQNYSFHPMCREVMMQFASKKLKKIEKISEKPAFNKFNNNQTGPYIFINPIINATSYKYYISEDSLFLNVIKQDSTKSNAIYFNFKNQKKYYLKFFAANNINSSDFSETLMYLKKNDAIEIPKPIFPINRENVLRNSNIELKFENVEGAEKYEIGLYDVISTEFASNSSYYLKPEPNFTSINNFKISPNVYYPGIGNSEFYWRVRAISKGKIGPWSELNQVLFNDLQLDFTFADLTNLPENLNIQASLLYRTVNDDLHFQIAKDSEFENIIFNNKIEQTEFMVVQENLFSGSLTRGNTFYCRLQEKNKKNEILRQIIKKIEIPKENQIIKLSYFNNIEYKQLGGNISAFQLFQNEIWGFNEKGLFKIDILDKKVSEYTRKNTNGLIGNKILSVGVDSLGMVIVLSYEDNGFDYRYYLNTFKREPFQLLSKLPLKVYVKVNPIYWIEPIHKSFINNNNKIIQRIAGDSTEILYKLETTQRFINSKSSKNYIWIETNNSINNSGYSEIIRYNVFTKEAKVFSKQNQNIFPTFLKSWVIDKNESLIVSTFSEVLKFDNDISSIIKIPNNLTNRTNLLVCDSYNNIFLKIEDSFTHVLKLKDNQFENYTKYYKLSDQSKYYFPTSEPLTIDNFGKFWVKNGLTNFAIIDPCNIQISPEIKDAPKLVEYGAEVTLVANGCLNTVWNWNNKEEKIENNFIPGQNKRTLFFKSNTTIKVNCVENGCSGDISTYKIKVLPKILLNNFSKSNYCINDSISITGKFEGNFEEINKFILVFKNGNNVYETQANTFIGLNFKPGKYWVKLKSTAPEVFSKDSVEITINENPKVTINGKLSFCDGQNTQLSALGEGGTAPYKYQWLQGNSKLGNENNYSVANTGNYSVTITDNFGCVGTSQAVNITKRLNPDVKISKSGNTELLQNGSVDFSVPKVNNQTYQWYKDGKAINDAISNSYTAYSAGVYSVEAILDGCKATSESITVNIVLSEEINAQHQIKVSPNPNNGAFRVDYFSPVLKRTNISFFNTLGQMIFQKNLKIIGEASESISVENIPSGNYYLRIQIGEYIKTIKVEKN